MSKPEEIRPICQTEQADAAGMAPDRTAHLRKVKAIKDIYWREIAGDLEGICMREGETGTVTENRGDGWIQVVPDSEIVNPLTGEPCRFTVSFPKELFEPV